MESAPIARAENALAAAVKRHWNVFKKPHGRTPIRVAHLELLEDVVRHRRHRVAGDGAANRDLAELEAAIDLNRRGDAIRPKRSDEKKKENSE